MPAVASKDAFASVMHAGDKRARSFNNLALAGEPAHKQRELSHALPVLAPMPGESKASYFRRLADSIDSSLYSAAHDFGREGIYLYKRPVRAAGNHAALLAQGGSVFHHVVVYIKTGDQLRALEFGPSYSMDITGNLMEEASAKPVLREAPELPEPQCLPMLHVAVPHHPLDAPHVRQALSFAESQPYQALTNNCIAFADYACRVLTGGVVRGAPLIFDAVCGRVPPVDSPMLALLAMTMQLTWFQICDGGRLMAAYLQRHPAPPLPPPTAPQAPAGTARSGLQDGIAAAAAAAAAEAEEAAAAAAAGVRRPAAAAAAAQAALVPPEQRAAAAEQQQVAAPAAPQHAPLAPAARMPAAAAVPAVPAAAAPADSGVSEETELVVPGGLSRSQSLLRSSCSSKSLGSAAAGGRFDPLGQVPTGRRGKQGGTSA